MTDSQGDNTPEKHRGLAEPWKPGESGNPKGRPKGSRSKIMAAFWDDLYAAWQSNGEQAIQAMITERPHEFVKVVASLMPKELILKDEDALKNMTDDELYSTLDTVRSLIAANVGRKAGAGEDDPGGEVKPHPVH